MSTIEIIGIIVFGLTLVGGFLFLIFWLISDGIEDTTNSIRNKNKKIIDNQEEILKELKELNNKKDYDNK